LALRFNVNVSKLMCKLRYNIKMRTYSISEHTFYNQAIVHQEKEVVPWGTGYLFKDHLFIEDISFIRE